MAARGKQESGSGPEAAGVRLLPPVLVPLSAVEDEALVEALAVALVPLLVSAERAASGLAPLAVGLEGGERGAGGDL